MIEKIAFYLPQFHAIPENDAWWGEGFTEWVNVRNAKPQYKGHLQPEIPLNSNYYNLLDKNVQKWQADLAQKYGINGFCYYHYWFEGRLLLEKPMENMLKNKEITIPFCICWANETWARTWDGQEQDILIKQNYDEGERAWIRHFEYLLPFFKDERYIKHFGKPMLLIYKPQLIKHIDKMLILWRKLAKQSGFPDLYIGYQHHSVFDYDVDAMGFDFGVEFEPFYTIRELKQKQKTALDKMRYYITHHRQLYRKLREKIVKKPTVYDYDEVWSYIIKRTPVKANIYPGAFTAWDNTPRRGRYANVFQGSSPEKFAYYFKKQMSHAENIYHADYIFINAWNEWAEGAHLEPDENMKYGYLEGIQ